MLLLVLAVHVLAVLAPYGQVASEQRDRPGMTVEAKQRLVQPPPFRSNLNRGLPCLALLCLALPIPCPVRRPAL